MNILDILRLLFPGFNSGSLLGGETNSGLSTDPFNQNDPLGFARTLQGQFNLPAPQNVRQLGGQSSFSNAPLGPAEPFSRPVPRSGIDKEMNTPFIPTAENPGTTEVGFRIPGVDGIVRQGNVTAEQRLATPQTRQFFGPGGRGEDILLPSLNPASNLFDPKAAAQRNTPTFFGRIG